MSISPNNSGQLFSVNQTASNVKVGRVSDDTQPAFANVLENVKSKLSDDQSDVSIQTRLINIAMTSITMYNKKPHGPEHEGPKGVMNVVEDLMMKIMEVLGVDQKDYQKQIAEMKSVNPDFDPEQGGFMMIAFSAIYISQNMETVSEDQAAQIGNHLDDVEGKVNSLKTFMQFSQTELQTSNMKLSGINFQTDSRESIALKLESMMYGNFPSQFDSEDNNKDTGLAGLLSV